MKQSATPANLTDTAEKVSQAVERLHRCFTSGVTQSIAFRVQSLKRLKHVLQENERLLLSALATDLGKSDFEGYATELGMIYEEINYCLKHIHSWTKPRRVATPLMHFPSQSKVYFRPLGVVLIMSPWNYPLQLALVPLVDALAAGNCVALKPSRTSSASAEVLAHIIDEAFDSNHVITFPGSADMNNWLLEERFDLIFFTGSPRIGKVVMHAAANHLTPVVLELGGKSPCIVDESANLEIAARRIAWGKGINAGQTCVAPDYFLVHENVVERFVTLIDEAFHDYYGKDILASPDWPRLINRHHFDRVLGLITERNPQSSLAFGGESDANTLRIAPTCLRGVTQDDPIMQEEIFGPVLPVITYKTLDEALSFTQNYEKPLAAYVFSESKATIERVLETIPCGGATINDVIVHLANNHMGFGGRGNSGMGAYHGKVGFNCFSHQQSTLTKSTRLDIDIRYPPFKGKLSLLKKIMH